MTQTNEAGAQTATEDILECNAPVEETSEMEACVIKGDKDNG